MTSVAQLPIDIAKAEDMLKLEQIIENEIKKSIGTRLKPTQYYIDVVPRVTQEQAETENSVAFTNLKIDIKKLKELSDLIKNPDFSKFSIQVEIFFDNT